MTDVDAKAQLAAVLAALNAPLSALTAPWTAYDLDKLPQTRPDTYVGVSVYRRYGEAARMPGKQSRIGWATTVQLVSKSGSNARLLHKIVTETLEDARLSVNGVLTSPICFETEDPIAEEDDVWNVGTLLWHYTHGGKSHA